MAAEVEATAVTAAVVEAEEIAAAEAVAVVEAEDVTADAMVVVAEAVAAMADAIVTAEAELNGCGRLLIRESGTEPLVRVMAEGEDDALICRVVNELCEMIAAETRVWEHVD